MGWKKQTTAEQEWPVVLEILEKLNALFTIKFVS